MDKHTIGNTEVMQNTYKIDIDQNLITVRTTGDVTVDGEIAKVESIMADPKFKKDMKVLGDLTGAHYDWTLDDIDKYRKFIKGIRTKLGKAKWAVTVSAGVTEHAAKLFSILQESHDHVVKVKIFTDAKKASTWLHEEK